MGEIKDVENGWNFMNQLLGADLASQSAHNGFVQNAIENSMIQAENAHIQSINDAIDDLARSINEHPKINLGVEQFKGFVAEEWHAGTFNIDAVTKGSEHFAKTDPIGNAYGSADIETNFGKSYSLKYSNTAKAAESMQAALDKHTGGPKYQGQERLIAAEQVDEAKALAHRRGLKDITNRPDVSDSHFDTEKHLVGKVSDGEGVESKELSVKESKQIANEAKEDKFDPEKHGYKKDPLMDEVRINYVNEALKAGMTAAAITAIARMVPELYKAIDYLIKNGELDPEMLISSGGKVLSASGEAFLRGSVAYLVEMAIIQGKFGSALQNVSPSIVGVAVTIIFGTIKDSILVAAGKMTVREMGNHFVDSLVVSSGYLVSMKIGGAIAQALLPELPLVGYAIGSLLGCSVAVMYNIGKKKLISFCVDTGFTCFGLVEQDYTLPQEILDQIGVDTIEIPRAEVSTSSVDRIDIGMAAIDRVQYETVEYKLVKRGVIGVSRVGYVL